MESTQKYMARMHLQLADDYRSESGTGRMACSLVALEVGERLMKEGAVPKILSVCADDLPLEDSDLIPLIFKNRWKSGWYAHHVCYCDGMVYDPLLDENPVPAEEYAQRMFGYNLPLRDKFSFGNFNQSANRQRRQ